MFFSDTSPIIFFFLMLPACINLWAIWHAMKHSFPFEKERAFWVMAGVFLPVIGGILYGVIGLRRSKPIEREKVK